LKLLCDVHISPLTVESLRKLGYDAIRVTERLPATAQDEELLVLARSEGCVLVTQDQDFGALLAANGEQLPSILSLRLGTARIERVNVAIASAIEIAAKQLESGAIVTVEDSRVRVRLLPIGTEPQPDK